MEGPRAGGSTATHDRVIASVNRPQRARPDHSKVRTRRSPGAPDQPSLRGRWHDRLAHKAGLLSFPGATGVGSGGRTNGERIVRGRRRRGVSSTPAGSGVGAAHRFHDHEGRFALRVGRTWSHWSYSWRRAARRSTTTRRGHARDLAASPEKHRSRSAWVAARRARRSQPGSARVTRGGRRTRSRASSTSFAPRWSTARSRRARRARAR